jgi:hypothetical protein
LSFTAEQRRTQHHTLTGFVGQIELRRGFFHFDLETAGAGTAPVSGSPMVRPGCGLPEQAASKAG